MKTIMVASRMLRAAGLAVFILTTGCQRAKIRHSPDRKDLSPEPVLTVEMGGGMTMELIYVESGKFMMGSNYEHAYRDETPVHEVAITEGYYLGKCEVTQAQYERLMDKNPSRFRRPDRPVNVSWQEAVGFCRTLSRQTGRIFRLPTEAEWEYACRAGSQTNYCFGDDDNSLAEYAWFESNSVGRTLTIRVGMKRPNAWGFHDMHGGFWEWCSDWYDEGYYSRSPREDPTGAESGTQRAVRGGGWGNEPKDCRSAMRLGVSAACAEESGRSGLGFRVACVPAQGGGARGKRQDAAPCVPVH